MAQRLTWDNIYLSPSHDSGRVFLNDCGVFLHMLGVRDVYYWKSKERRESGDDKREFEELLKQDWLEFDLHYKPDPQSL